MPRVSVVVPSYNHEKFVSRSIRSALEQSFSDLEVIVVDDGSQDASVDIIRSIDDRRLRLIAFEKNQGAAEATNRGIVEASGEFIAILNSDDRWLPNKIEEQVAILEKTSSIGAVFTWARFIDEDDRSIDPDGLPFGKVFEVENRSRGLWLQQFLLKSNCLCHPSVLIRRSVYDRVGLYDERLRQLPDLDMWVRVCSLYDIHVLPKEMTLFRLLQGERNTSSGTRSNHQRTLAENMLLAEKFFDQVDLRTFNEGFADMCVATTVASPEQQLIEQAFLLVGNASDLGKAYKPVGFQQLYDLLGRQDTAQILRDVYNFGTKQFHEILGKNKLPVL